VTTRVTDDIPHSDAEIRNSDSVELCTRVDEILEVRTNVLPLRPVRRREVSSRLRESVEVSEDAEHRVRNVGEHCWIDASTCRVRVERRWRHVQCGVPEPRCLEAEVQAAEEYRADLTRDFRAEEFASRARAGREAGTPAAIWRREVEERCPVVIPATVVVELLVLQVISCRVYAEVLQAPNQRSRVRVVVVRITRLEQSSDRHDPCARATVDVAKSRSGSISAFFEEPPVIFIVEARRNRA
jgi:hypothetical protein